MLGPRNALVRGEDGAVTTLCVAAAPAGSGDVGGRRGSTAASDVGRAIAIEQRLQRHPDSPRDHYLVTTTATGWGGGRMAGAGNGERLFGDGSGGRCVHTDATAAVVGVCCNLISIPRFKIAV